MVCKEKAYVQDKRALKLICTNMTCAKPLVATAKPLSDALSAKKCTQYQQPSNPMHELNI